MSVVGPISFRSWRPQIKRARNILSPVGLGIALLCFASLRQRQQTCSLLFAMRFVLAKDVRGLFVFRLAVQWTIPFNNGASAAAFPFFLFFFANRAVKGETSDE